MYHSHIWLEYGIVNLSHEGNYEIPTDCPLQLIGVYSITKLAMLGVVKTLSTELASSNIRVNAIAPGLIDTKFSAAVRSYSIQWPVFTEGARQGGWKEKSSRC